MKISKLILSTILLSAALIINIPVQAWPIGHEVSAGVALINNTSLTLQWNTDGWYESASPTGALNAGDNTLIKGTVWSYLGMHPTVTVADNKGDLCKIIPAIGLPGSTAIVQASQGLNCQLSDSINILITKV